MTQLAKNEQATTNVVLNGAGWTTVADATPAMGASGASYATNTTAGRTVTITTPAGTTTAFVGYTARPDSPTAMTYAVDGGAATTWSQQSFSGTPTNPQYFWYRALSPPIAVTNDGAAHTVTITTSAGTASIDFVECYGASAATAGKMITFGHSIAAGFSPGGGGDPANPIPGRFSALVATYLGGATTDGFNFGTPSEDLTNGGITGGADNSQFYNNTAVTTPGWRRAETGTQWWAATPQYALVHHGLNDAGYTTLYDAATAVPLANRDAAGDTITVAAGAGYALARYKQRFRELLWRMNANCPTAEITVVGIATQVSTDAPTLRATWRAYNAAMQAVCAESTVANAYYVDTLAATTSAGGSAIMCSDNAHPNTAGHRIMANEIVKRLDGVHGRSGAFGGMR